MSRPLTCALRMIAACGLLHVAPTALPAQEAFHRGTAPAPAPGTLFLFPERIPTDDGGLADAERGWLFVRANRSDPESHVMAVEIYRFRARAETGRPPIFRLYGGPGWPGLRNQLEQPDWEQSIGRFTEHADYVVIGQRGIGSSKPNTICASAAGARGASQTCREYWDSKGVDLPAINVIEAAGDVADAAAALGYDSIVVWGGSFGSHWGMAVLRYHPEIVARAVLTGMEGPNHTYDSPSWVLNSLERMATAAGRSEALAPLIPDGGLIEALRTVRARLMESGPVRVTVPHPETGEEESMQFTAFNVPGWADGYTQGAGSRSGARTWPADILRLYYGDFEGVARIRLERAAAATGGGPSFRTAAFFTLDCGSGITADRLAELRADSARLLVGDRTFFYQVACPPWEVDLGDAFRQNFDTQVPTAIVHGNWDLSTPYENALELAPHFKNGKLVTVMGGTHGALGEAMQLDSAFHEAIFAFARTGDLRVLPDSVVLPEIDWVVPDDVRRLAIRH